MEERRDKAERWRYGIENKIWRKEETWKSERNIEEIFRYGNENEIWRKLRYR